MAIPGQAGNRVSEPLHCVFVCTPPSAATHLPLTQAGGVGQQAVGRGGVRMDVRGGSPQTPSLHRVCLSLSVCVCVCVCEREGKCVCVCMCMISIVTLLTRKPFCGLRKHHASYSY